MTEREDKEEMIKHALEYFQGRNITATSAASGIVYIEPLPLVVPEGGQHDPDRLENMWAGLQLYKARCTEALGALDDNERVNLVLEIFNDENLVTLAQFAEIQTGTKGVVQAMLESFEWAEWEIEPQGVNLTEWIYTEPHIDLRVTLGSEQKSIGLVSHRKIKIENNGEGWVNQAPYVNIHEKGKEWDYDNEHDALPEFDLRYVEVMPNKGIRFEGVPWGFEEDVDDDNQRDYFSYILMSDGSFRGDIRKKPDRIRARIQSSMIEIYPADINVVADSESFDGGEIYKIMFRTPLSRKALTKFLLPYCDAPLVGVKYILPED